MPREGRPLPTVHRLSPGIYYGWFIVAGTFALSFVSVGIGFYGQTVFLDALIHEKGWSKASVSGGSTLFFMTSGMAGVLVGRAVDRWGSRRMLAAGALCMATALLWLGRIDRPHELYFVYALLAVSFAMSAAIPLTNLINRWFVAQRSRAMSLSQTGVSVGGLVLMPLATTFIAVHGIRSATTGLALLVLAVTLPVILLILRDDPGAHGLPPDGGRPARSRAIRTLSPATERSWRARDAVRTSAFVLLAASFGSILLCQTGVAVHHLHLLRQHMDTSAAAFGAATIPVGSIVGRLVAGRFADQFDKRRVAATLFTIQALAIAALSTSAHPIPLLLASVAFGLTIGAVFMMQGLLVAEIFGLPSYGTVFGAVSLITGIGGGLGPLTVGLLSESAGGYPGALRTLLLIAPLSAIAVLCVRPPQASSS